MPCFRRFAEFCGFSVHLAEVVCLPLDSRAVWRSRVAKNGGAPLPAYAPFSDTSRARQGASSRTSRASLPNHCLPSALMLPYLAKTPPHALPPQRFVFDLTNTTWCFFDHLSSKPPAHTYLHACRQCTNICSYLSSYWVCGAARIAYRVYPQSPHAIFVCWCLGVYSSTPLVPGPRERLPAM